ncbi:MAG TPA: single-stranded DNA-binding protein [bacterium]|nr:single-stranded DNA-binding protein [bacterium]HPN44874.1 single-stranded DNA-binding protein [bacterium]
MSELKMPDINNVLIAGNLTSDPVYRKTNNGTAVTNFFIASNRKYRDNSGIWRENLCFVGVVAWHRLADTCNEILKKGSAVLIDGELQSRNWRNEDGTSRNVVEIRARRIQFLDKALSAEVEEFASQELDDKNLVSNDERANISHPLPEENLPVEPVKEIKVEPTEFDFGYKNLNL